MDTRKRRRRLLALANHLEEVEKEAFYMGTWGSHAGDHKPEEDNFCGTRACALGHAAFMPKFRAKGLKMKWQARWDWTTGAPNSDLGYEGIVKYKRLDGEYAGAAFFGLSLAEACNLFLGGGSRKYVIKKLRKLAEKPFVRSEEVTREEVTRESTRSDL